MYRALLSSCALALAFVGTVSFGARVSDQAQRLMATYSPEALLTLTAAGQAQASQAAPLEPGRPAVTSSSGTEAMRQALGL